jgi:deoxyhypusine synthase
LPAFVDCWRRARAERRPVILMMGGHPIKLGLSRFLIDLMERGFITRVATNGAGIIHDFELGLLGGTSEDVARWIRVGQFGLWQETSRLNDVVAEAARNGEGLGEAVGRTIEDGRFAHRELSVAAAGWRLGLPVTCHVSVDSDIVHATRWGRESCVKCLQAMCRSR